MRTILAIALVAVLAGCAHEAVPQIANVPAAPDVMQPHAPPCPAINKVFTRGNTSAKFESNFTLIKYPRNLSWTVVFKNQKEAAAPVQFEPFVRTCGPAGQRDPIGTVKLGSGGSTSSHCTNGVCTVTVVYNIVYTPPNTAAKLPWKWDFIKFKPTKPKPGFGPMNGVRMEVRRNL